MLHRAGGGFLHRADPLTKLALVLAGAAMLPLWPAPVLLAAAAAGAGLAFASGFGRAHAAALAILIAPLAVAMVAVHGLLIERGDPRSLGPLVYSPEGLAHAGLVLSRVALLLSVSLAFVMSTRPSDLARSCDHAGLPPALSFLLVAPLAFVEAADEEVRLMRDAMRARGLAARDPKARLRQLATLAMLLPRALVTEAPARASALEGRGFRASARRRPMVEPAIPRAEILLRRVLLGVAAVQVAAALS